MIEEHVSFHFQQLSSWIDRVLMCYFTFLKVEKSGIFFWKPEIRPTLTAQKKYSKVCLGFIFFSHDEAACQFSFKSLLSTIIYLFDILFDFPGGRKIRKILPGFSRSQTPRSISISTGLNWSNFIFYYSACAKSISGPKQELWMVSRLIDV